MISGSAAGYGALAETIIAQAIQDASEKRCVPLSTSCTQREVLRQNAKLFLKSAWCENLQLLSDMAQTKQHSTVTTASVCKEAE